MAADIGRSPPHTPGWDPVAAVGQHRPICSGRALHPEVGERSNHHGHVPSVAVPGNQSRGSSATQHDFVIMVGSTRGDVEALRDEVSAVLAPMGLRLSVRQDTGLPHRRWIRLLRLAYPTPDLAEPSQQEGCLHLPIQEVTRFCGMLEISTRDCGELSCFPR